MRLRKQLLTRNYCYTCAGVIRPRGVMVHSTGSNNPNVSRYVPGNGEIGWNARGNHWNQTNAEWKAKYDKPLNKCVHAFVGLFADGKVGAVQALPWNMRGWHCAGKANNTHIGFEICEDGLSDPAYFQAVYQEAAELTAYLCKEYGLDPLADGVVICHQEGYRRGLASNHGDVLHWFPRMGKTMDDFRADVARLMEGDDDMDQSKFNEMFRVAMDAYRKDLSAKPASPALTGLFAEAKAMGLTDGTRPRDLVTREEAAVMALAAALK